jgi:hypothetical protein
MDSVWQGQKETIQLPHLREASWTAVALYRFFRLCTPPVGKRLKNVPITLIFL